MLKIPSGSPSPSPDAGYGSMIVPIQIDDRYRGWSGPAEELGEIASKELKRTDPQSVGEASDDQAELNERAIRYYVSMGVLDPPGRVGKESRYRWRHLV